MGVYPISSWHYSDCILFPNYGSSLLMYSEISLKFLVNNIIYIFSCKEIKSYVAKNELIIWWLWARAGFRGQGIITTNWCHVFKILQYYHTLLDFRYIVVKQDKDEILCWLMNFPRTWSSDLRFKSPIFAFCCSSFNLIWSCGISTFVGLFKAKSYLYIYIKSIWFGLVEFYGLSTIVGHSMSNPLYAYIIHTVWVGFMAYQTLIFTQPLRSGRIWHKVNF